MGIFGLERYIRRNSVNFLTYSKFSFHLVNRWCPCMLGYLKSSFSTHSSIDRSPERVDSRGSWKSKTTYFGVKLPGISSVASQKRILGRPTGSRSAPPGGATKTSSQHAVRRHMQNEYKKDVLNKASNDGGKTEDVTTWWVVKLGNGIVSNLFSEWANADRKVNQSYILVSEMGKRGQPSAAITTTHQQENGGE